MNQITEQLYAEKVAQLQSHVDQLQTVVTVLVWKLGQGKRISIPKGVVREATARVDSLEYRQLATGELRITTKQREKESRE